MRYPKIVIFIVLFFVLRGPIFRMCFCYHPIKSIPLVALRDTHLRQQIGSAAQSLPENDVKQWAKYSQRFTAQHLQFNTQAKSSLPDEVWRNGEAHCVGYAALMGAVLQEVINNSGLTNYQVEQIRADIYLFGFRLTGPDRPVFFRDHDYIRLTNTLSDDQWHFDPNLYDYTWIARIR